MAQRGRRQRRKKRQRAGSAGAEHPASEAERAESAQPPPASAAERSASAPPRSASAAGPRASAAEPPASPPQRPGGGYYARSRQRDAEARARLEPLERGERPTAVTVGALLALALALGNFGAWLAGLEIQGDRPAITGVAAYSGLMLLVAYGMWKARYWAVLGMHALLAILILVFALLAVQAENVVSLLIALAVIGGAGTLFWFLIKAMARIQMPTRPGSEPR